MANRNTRTHTRKKQAASLLRQNRLPEARDLFLKICRHDPRDTESLVTLAVLNRRLGAFPEAERCAREALGHDPESPSALHALGAALQCQGRLDDAITSYINATRLAVDYVEAHYFLANALRERGRAEAAIAAYERTLEIQPDHVEALNNLAALLTSQGSIGRSVRYLERALEVQPDKPQMLINLARANLHTGDAEQAEKTFRRAIELQPEVTGPHDNLLQTLNYLPTTQPEQVFSEHLRWADVQTGKLARPHAYPNDNSPGRKLRIGYVSPDLCEHSVARFLEPVLARHNAENVEIVCYADVISPDNTTRRLKSYCSRFIFTSKLSDEQLAGTIRSDRIDILVDLAGHTANNRLLVFARKPAPVQVSWLGYPNTTGLATIDYRFTDQWADPVGSTETLHTEALYRLPGGFLCYGPPEDSPAVAPLPSEAGGHITFGSFNNLAKVTPQLVGVWSKILLGVDGSRLALKSRASSDPGVRQRYIELFSKQGIAADRLLFLDPVAGLKGHLDKYNQVDIGLDTFPYNGTTTSCEALWMGVPVLTQAGRVHASRVGASLLSQLHLEELIASGQDDYINKAIELANDTTRLADLRKGMRQRMAQATLCNASAFTKTLENAYRSMWEKWCISPGQG